MLTFLPRHVLLLRGEVPEAWLLRLHGFGHVLPGQLSEHLGHRLAPHRNSRPDLPFSSVGMFPTEGDTEPTYWIRKDMSKWRALPAGFPPWRTVWGFMARWAAAGIIGQIR